MDRVWALSFLLTRKAKKWQQEKAINLIYNTHTWIKLLFSILSLRRKAFWILESNRTKRSSICVKIRKCPLYLYTARGFKPASKEMTDLERYAVKYANKAKIYCINWITNLFLCAAQSIHCKCSPDGLRCRKQTSNSAIKYKDNISTTCINQFVKMQTVTRCSDPYLSSQIRNTGKVFNLQYLVTFWQFILVTFLNQS